MKFCWHIITDLELLFFLVYLVPKSFMLAIILCKILLLLAGWKYIVSNCSLFLSSYCRYCFDEYGMVTFFLSFFSYWVWGLLLLSCFMYSLIWGTINYVLFILVYVFYDWSILLRWLTHQASSALHYHPSYSGLLIFLIR